MSDPVSAPASSAPPCVTVPAERSQWFRDQVHAHDAQLKSYLRGSFPAVRDVDDIVQESYLRVWQARAKQPIQSAKAFLFRVAHNLALKTLRKEGHAPFVRLRDSAALGVIEDRPNAAHILCAREKIDLIADAVMTLPPRCREIIILHKLQGRPQKEVAAQLGLSERSVESQTRIGVKRCLVFLQKRGITDFYGDEA